MREHRLAKIVFYASSITLFAVAMISVGLHAGVYRTSLFHFAKAIKDNVVLVWQDLPTWTSDEPVYFLMPARDPGSGVTVNRVPGDGDLIFLTGFFDGQTGLRLIRRDGSVVRRWPVSFGALFPAQGHMESPPRSDRHIDIHGGLINPDGSVVFNFEYGGTVKLSRCGETLWTLEHPTHHSVEPAEGGGYWIPGRVVHLAPAPNALPPFSQVWRDLGYREDLILRVSEDGRILEQVSVPRILYDSGLGPVLTANGESFEPEASSLWDRELVHLNKIEELTSDLVPHFPDFEAGDLALSLRTYNLVVVVDPDNWRVKWHQTGPWQRQHDPRFNADGTISVFNNNVYQTGDYWTSVGPDERPTIDAPRVSNIMKIDPRTRRTEVVFGGRPGQEFLSHARGKHFPTPDGGFLVAEFDAGRVFETDVQGTIVWEYINRYDSWRVLEVTEARVYDEAYFEVSDWSCP